MWPIWSLCLHSLSAILSFQDKENWYGISVLYRKLMKNRNAWRGSCLTHLAFFYGNQSMEVASIKKKERGIQWVLILSKSNPCTSPPTSWTLIGGLLKHAVFEETAAKDFAASKSHFNSIMIFLLFGIKKTDRGIKERVPGKCLL